MTCSACNDVVRIKSSNYDYCWRSHQSNCCNKNRGKIINQRDFIFSGPGSSGTVGDTIIENVEDCFENEENVFDSWIEDERDIMLDEKSNSMRESDILEEYQSRIGKLYDCDSSNFPFRVRGGRQTNWQQYAFIHEYVVNKNLSIRDGDDLIDLLNIVQSPLQGHARRQLPKNYITIHQANYKANSKLRELF